MQPISDAKLPAKEEMYRALVNKDIAYEGVFVAAIKTTGIFCRSSCHARKPKKENVEYYSSNSEALSYGFRPCKVCKPLETFGETPAWITALLEDVLNQIDLRYSDQDMRRRGVEPAKLRRWFKKHHGMTFQAYLRALRLNRAIGRIKQSQKVTDAAFSSGYESLSGFNEAFKEAHGFFPNKESSTNSSNHYSHINAPWPNDSWFN